MTQKPKRAIFILRSRSSQKGGLGGLSWLPEAAPLHYTTAFLFGLFSLPPRCSQSREVRHCLTVPLVYLKARSWSRSALGAHSGLSHCCMALLSLRRSPCCKANPIIHLPFSDLLVAFASLLSRIVPAFTWDVRRSFIEQNSSHVCHRSK